MWKNRINKLDRIIWKKFFFTKAAKEYNKPIKSVHKKNVNVFVNWEKKKHMYVLFFYSNFVRKYLNI